MSYEEAAVKIIKDYIKTAVYIDENAIEPYEIDSKYNSLLAEGGESKNESPEQKDTPETKLQKDEAQRSMDLYREFRKQGVSLSVIKYQDKLFEQECDFVLDARDLVLLDWKLEGDENSPEKALKIMENIVSRSPKINFCAIYTNEALKDFDQVKTIISHYFSGLEKSDQLKDLFEDVDDEDKKEVHNLLEQYLNPNTTRERKTTICSQIRNDYKMLYDRLLEIKAPNNDSVLKIRIGCISLADTILPQNALPKVQFWDYQNGVFIIQDTIFMILSKKNIKPECIIEVFSKNISDQKTGCMKLLGLEMANQLREISPFISRSVLSVSNDALAFHKQNKPEDFDSFVQEVMFSHAKTQLQGKTSILLSTLTPIRTCPKEEITTMNRFYNSVVIENKKRMSFGDVFSCNGKYYLCISPLCDCAHPKKDRIYYFALGENADETLAMKEKEDGYISYTDFAIINWRPVSNDEDNSKNYVIPRTFFIPSLELVDNELKAYNIIDINEKNITLPPKIEVKDYNFKYIATIKQNYTQRIANFAFTHSTRVGIDFVEYPDNSTNLDTE